MSTDEDLLLDIVNRIGVSSAKKIIAKAQVGNENCLTIISNGGLHNPPDDFVEGELFFASQGNLKMDSVDEVNRTIDDIVANLKVKLLSQTWHKIYLIPFGPALISMTVKLAVFRTLWIDTIDVYYFGNGRYGAIERDSRAQLVRSEPPRDAPDNV